MNFQELYYQDPYQTTFEAEVTSCTETKGGYLITLDRTLFYPEGGGQPSDRGTICCLPDGPSFPVIDVRDSAEGVQHLIGDRLDPGTRIRGDIDWAFRFPLMQNHTGEHIISGIAHRRYGYENVGFHMSDVITLDLSGPLTWEQAVEIEREANEIVYQNLPVEIRYPDEQELDTIDYRSKKELDGDVRIIHIENADDCACCGLHVRSTGEVGVIKLLSLMNHRGGVRLTMLSGRQALLDYEMRADETLATGQLLSVKPHEISGAVRHLLDETLAKDRRIALINQRYFQAKADLYTEKTNLIFCPEEQMNQVELRKFCDLLVKTGKGRVCAVLTESAPGAWQYCIGSTEVDLRAAAGPLNQALNGRGGGKPVMIQGTFHAGIEAIEAALKQISS